MLQNTNKGFELSDPDARFIAYDGHMIGYSNKSTEDAQNTLKLIEYDLEHADSKTPNIGIWYTDGDADEDGLEYGDKEFTHLTIDFDGSPAVHVLQTWPTTRDDDEAVEECQRVAKVFGVELGMQVDTSFEFNCPEGITKEEAIEAVKNRALAKARLAAEGKGK